MGSKMWADEGIGPYKFYRTFPTSIRRKSRARLWPIEGVWGNHPEGSPTLLFLFFTGRGDSFLSQRRERKEWGRKKTRAANGRPYDEHSKIYSKIPPGLSGRAGCCF